MCLGARRCNYFKSSGLWCLFLAADVLSSRRPSSPVFLLSSRPVFLSHTFPPSVRSTASRRVNMQMYPTHHYGGEACNRSNWGHGITMLVTCETHGLLLTELTRLRGVADVEFWVIIRRRRRPVMFDMTWALKWAAVLVFLFVWMCFTLKIRRWEQLRRRQPRAD